MHLVVPAFGSEKRGGGKKSEKKAVLVWVQWMEGSIGRFPWAQDWRACWAFRRGHVFFRARGVRRL